MTKVLLILHVATAVFIVGPMAILPMTGLRVLRSGHGTQAAALARSTSLFAWLSLITFVLGFGVAGMAGVSMGTPWILWSIILYAVAFALTVFLVVPRLHKAAKALTDGSAESRPAGYGAIAAGSGVSALLLVAVVVLMAWHP